MDSPTTEKVKTWVIFLLFGLAMVALVFVVNGRFNAGTQRRHDICVEINSVKKILREEHLPKLKKAQQNLRRYPAGLTIHTNQGLVRVTRRDLLDARKDEARIVNQTRQKECP